MLPEAVRNVCAAETSRDIVAFRQIEADMSFAEICALVGVPDRDIGSGLYVFVYDLDDGSVVVMGFASLSRVMYVNHVYEGGSESLLP